MGDAADDAYDAAMWEDDEPDIEDDGLDECGMGSDGQCTLAGSEWCDWDWPLDKTVSQPTQSQKEG